MAHECHDEGQGISLLPSFYSCNYINKPKTCKLLLEHKQQKNDN